MTQIRKHYTAQLKAQLVQEAMAGEKTIGQIAAQHGVHPNLISKWRQAAIKAMPTAFDEEGTLQRQIEALKAEHEREKEALYAEIGRLTTQVNWLQKKMGTGTLSAGKAGVSRTRKP